MVAKKISEELVALEGIVGTLPNALASDKKTPLAHQNLAAAAAAATFWHEYDPLQIHYDQQIQSMAHAAVLQSGISYAIGSHQCFLPTKAQAAEVASRMSGWCSAISPASNAYYGLAAVKKAEHLSDPQLQTVVASQIAGLASSKQLAQQFLESIGVITAEGILTKNFGG